jgi:hypothetical protein
MRVLAGHTSKFRKAVFYEITRSANAYLDVIAKSDRNRCDHLDRSADVHGDRVHSWDDNRTHRVALNCPSNRTLAFSRLVFSDRVLLESTIHAPSTAPRLQPRYRMEHIRRVSH